MYFFPGTFLFPEWKKKTFKTAATGHNNVLFCPLLLLLFSLLSIFLSFSRHDPPLYKLNLKFQIWSNCLSIVSFFLTGYISIHEICPHWLTITLSLTCLNRTSIGACPIYVFFCHAMIPSYITIFWTRDCWRETCIFNLKMPTTVIDFWHL